VSRKGRGGGSGEEAVRKVEGEMDTNEGNYATPGITLYINIIKNPIQ